MNFDIPLGVIIAGALIFYLWPLLLIAGEVAIGALVAGAHKIALVAALAFFSPVILEITGQIIFPIIDSVSDTYIGKKISGGFSALVHFKEWASTPSLVYAVEHQNEEKVAKLLKKGKAPNCHGGEFDYTPLQQSCEKYDDIGKADRITLLLLEAGANPNGQEGDHPDRAPIQRAIFSERKNAVRLLISHGAAIDEYSIGNCFSYGLPEEAELMLTLVENPTTISPDSFRDSDYDSKRTVLMYIMNTYRKEYKESLDILKRIFTMLIERGCDVNAQDSHGRTALYYFASRFIDKNTHIPYEGYAELAKLLADSGADANRVDENGDTPLMVIFYYYESKTIEQLLAITKLFVSFGADVSIKNNKAQTALDIFHENYPLERRKPEEIPDYEELERHLTPKRQKVALSVASGQDFSPAPPSFQGGETHLGLSDMADGW